MHVDVAGGACARANKNRMFPPQVGGSGDGERNGLWDGNGGGDLAWSLELEGTVGKKGAFGSSEGCIYDTALGPVAGDVVGLGKSRGSLCDGVL